MRKRWIALMMAACMVAGPVNCFADEETDYSYLEDMTVKELKALRDAIDEILGDESSEKDSDSIDYVEGTYYGVNTYFDDKCDYKLFTPDNAGKTIGTYKSEDALFSYIGDYRIEGDMLTAYNSYGNTVYQIQGKYLIPHEYDYDGEIPDEDFFSARVTYEDDYIIFNEDGSYSRKNGKTIRTGKYERQDDFIILHNDEGTTRAGLVINGIFNNSAFFKE